MIEGDNYPPATWKWQLANFLVSSKKKISLQFDEIFSYFVFIFYRVTLSYC